jgi:hypothetical protein
MWRLQLIEQNRFSFVKSIIYLYLSTMIDLQ